MAICTNEPGRRKFPGLETLGRYRNRLMKERREAEERLEHHLRQRPASFAPSPDRLRFMAELFDGNANENIGTNQPEASVSLQPDAAGINDPEPNVTPEPNSPRGEGGADVRPLAS